MEISQSLSEMLYRSYSVWNWQLATSHVLLWYNTGHLVVIFMFTSGTKLYHSLTAKLFFDNSVTLIKITALWSTAKLVYKGQLMPKVETRSKITILDIKVIWKHFIEYACQLWRFYLYSLFCRMVQKLWPRLKNFPRTRVTDRRNKN